MEYQASRDQQLERKTVRPAMHSVVTRSPTQLSIYVTAFKSLYQKQNISDRQGKKFLKTQTICAAGKGFGNKPSLQEIENALKKKPVPVQFDLGDSLDEAAPPGMGAGALDSFSMKEQEVTPLDGAKSGRVEISISTKDIHSLDVTSARAVLDPFIASPSGVDDLLKATVGFRIDYPLEQGDIRELCEVPEVRLWFIRLDSLYPWLSIALDWKAGELARYTAMLVPHQISKRDGLIYNPEAVELFLVSKLFSIYDWLVKNEVPQPTIRMKDMTVMLGRQFDDAFFDML